MVALYQLFPYFANKNSTNNSNLFGFQNEQIYCEFCVYFKAKNKSIIIKILIVKSYFLMFSPNFKNIKN